MPLVPFLGLGLPKTGLLDGLPFDIIFFYLPRFTNLASLHPTTAILRVGHLKIAPHM
jgi:hypothetical protein